MLIWVGELQLKLEVRVQTHTLPTCFAWIKVIRPRSRGFSGSVVFCNSCSQTSQENPDFVCSLVITWYCHHACAPVQQFSRDGHNMARDTMMAV